MASLSHLPSVGEASFLPSNSTTRHSDQMDQILLTWVPPQTGIPKNTRDELPKPGGDSPPHTTHSYLHTNTPQLHPYVHCIPPPPKHTHSHLHHTSHMQKAQLSTHTHSSCTLHLRAQHPMQHHTYPHLPLHTPAPAHLLHTHSHPTHSSMHALTPTSCLPREKSRPAAGKL